MNKSDIIFIVGIVLILIAFIDGGIIAGVLLIFGIVFLFYSNKNQWGKIQDRVNR